VAEFGPDTNFTLRPPREPDETLWVLVRGKWEGTLYLDPATGAEQGRRGTHEGAYNLRSSCTAACCWTARARASWRSWRWPTCSCWSRAWCCGGRRAGRRRCASSCDRGLLRGLFDLHRTGGAVLGLLIAVSVATGAYMAWRPLGNFISGAAWARSR
jgi:hypothetical protein